MLSKKRIREKDNKDLLKSLLNLEDMLMIEANSRRGVTKRTSHNFMLCIEEMCQRLDIEYDENDWNE